MTWASAVCEHTFASDGATILHADLDAFSAAVEQRAARAGGELDGTGDGVRDRFGPDAIPRAVLLGRDQGVPAPAPPGG